MLSGEHLRCVNVPRTVSISGYVLARPWWRQGLMTEVLTEVTVWALRQPSVFRIGAVCDFENIGSARVLEKSGFIREGLLRCCTRTSATNRETALATPAYVEDHRSEPICPAG